MEGLLYIYIMDINVHLKYIVGHFCDDVIRKSTSQEKRVIGRLPQVS